MAGVTPIQINFANHTPIGLDLHDIIWYSDASTGEEVEMGPVTTIVNNEDTSTYYIIVNAGTGVSAHTTNAAYGVAAPTTDDFVYYKKNPIGYVSSLKGYFAEAQFVNTDIKYAELFSVGTEVFESSK